MGIVESKPQSEAVVDFAVKSAVVQSTSATEEPPTIPTKVIFIGNRRSGCSTLIKQLELLSGKEEPSVDERKQSVDSIRLNMIIMMKTLIQNCQTDQQHHMDSSIEHSMIHTCDDLSQLVKDWSNTSAVLQQLWTMPIVQQSYSRQAEFALKDNCKYFFDELPGRIAKHNYEPTVLDLLHNSVRTMGFTERDVVIERSYYRLIDLGSSGKLEAGLTSLTKVQSHAVPIFVCSLSEFVLPEQQQHTLLYENYQIFSRFCQKESWAERTEMILVFTKLDVFRDYIHDGYNIKSTFPDYSGPADDWEQSLQHIKQKFSDCKRGLPIHTIAVVATQAESVKDLYNQIASFHFTQHEINEL